MANDDDHTAGAVITNDDVGTRLRRHRRRRWCRLSVAAACRHSTGDDVAVHLHGRRRDRLGLARRSSQRTVIGGAVVVGDGRRQRLRRLAGVGAVQDDVGRWQDGCRHGRAVVVVVGWVTCDDDDVVMDAPNQIRVCRTQLFVMVCTRRRTRAGPCDATPLAYYLDDPGKPMPPVPIGRTIGSYDPRQAAL